MYFPHRNSNTLKSPLQDKHSPDTNCPHQCGSLKLRTSPQEDHLPFWYQQCVKHGSDQLYKFGGSYSLFRVNNSIR